MASATSTSRGAGSGVPQGSKLGPFLYNVTVDAALSLPYSTGTHYQQYADDSVFIRAVHTAADVQALQGDVEMLSAFLAGVGLALNGAKTQCLVAAFRPDLRQLPAPLVVAGVEVLVGPSLRLLGVDWDPLLTWDIHWRRVCGSFRGTVAVLRRQMAGHKEAVRSAVLGRVVARILHSLPSNPPSTQHSSDRLRSTFSRAARAVTNNYVVGCADVLLLAGLPSMDYALFRSSLRFLWRCLFAGRAYGRCLERVELESGARWLRSSASPVTRLVVVAEEREHLRRFQCWRLPVLWNALPWAAAGVNAASAVATLASFDAALPALYEALPVDVRSRLLLT